MTEEERDEIKSESMWRSAARQRQREQMRRAWPFIFELVRQHEPPKPDPIKVSPETARWFDATTVHDVSGLDRLNEKPRTK